MVDELVDKMALPRIRKKYHIDNDAIEILLALMALRGDLVQPNHHIKACRDPDDDIVLDTAVSGNANSWSRATRIY
jgi:putative PIN family toxin of toxin-antitoxin system